MKWVVGIRHVYMSYATQISESFHTCERVMSHNEMTRGTCHPKTEEIGLKIITTAKIWNEFSRESPYITLNPKHVFTGVPKYSSKFSRQYTESPALKRSYGKTVRSGDPNILSMISSVSGYTWVMLHIWMSPFPQVNGSCHKTSTRNCAFTCVAWLHKHDTLQHTATHCNTLQHTATRNCTFTCVTWLHEHDFNAELHIQIWTSHVTKLMHKDRSTSNVLWLMDKDSSTSHIWCANLCICSMIYI